MSKEMSVRRMCCITGCGNRKDRPNSDDLMFYGFPNLPWQSAKRQLWIDLVRRKNSDGTPWNPSNRAFICSAHFIGNRKSEHPRHPSYLPTIFPPCYGDQSKQPPGKRKLKRIGNSPKRKSQRLHNVITAIASTTNSNSSSNCDDINRNNQSSISMDDISATTTCANSDNDVVSQLSASTEPTTRNNNNGTCNNGGEDVDEPSTSAETTMTTSNSNNNDDDDRPSTSSEIANTGASNNDDDWDDEDCDRPSTCSEIANTSACNNDDDWDDEDCDRPSSSMDILPSALMEVEMVVDEDGVAELNFEPEVCLMVDAATEADFLSTPVASTECCTKQSLATQTYSSFEPPTMCDRSTSIGADATSTPNTFLFCQGFHGFSSIGNDAEMLDLTGVTRATFSEIMKRLAIPIRQWKLSKSNRLLAYLMKNKLGLSDTVLAVLFGVNRETISGIFLGYMIQFREATRNYLSLNSSKILPDTP